MVRNLLTAILVSGYVFIAFTVGALLGQEGHLEGFTQKTAQWVQSALSNEASSSIEKELAVWSQEAEPHQDGVLLLASHFINNPALVLVDTKGQILHRWNVEKNIFNPETINLHKPFGKTLEDAVFGIEDAILLPDGSVIFSQSIQEFNNFRAQRIARMDKDSNILWQLPGLFHHDMIMAENGNIYTVGSELKESLPFLERGTHPNALFVSGVIKEISTEGKLLKALPVEEAFARSEFAPLLSSFYLDIPVQQESLKEGRILFDPLHLNSVDYISKEQASHLPFAEVGDLLISLRGNSVIAILRPVEKKIIWAMRGPWRHQHYVRMTDKGTILIYDNDGGGEIASSPKGKPGFRMQSRVLELDPITRKTTVVFSNTSGEDLYSYWRGYYHMLGKEGMIISFPEKGRVLQVNNENKIVWELRTIRDRNADNVPYTKKLPSVKFYDKKDLPFLDCGQCGAAAIDASAQR